MSTSEQMHLDGRAVVIVHIIHETTQPSAAVLLEDWLAGWLAGWRQAGWLLAGSRDAGLAGRKAGGRQ
jgi:hypothetical protein